MDVYNQSGSSAEEVRNSFKIKLKNLFLYLIFMLIMLVVSFGVSKLLKKTTNNVDKSRTELGHDSSSLPTAMITDNATRQDSRPFDKEKIYYIYPILKNRKLFYLKKGDIWVVDLSSKENDPKVFFDSKEDILFFDISNNQNLIVYSVNRYSLEDNNQTKNNGDTMMFKNLTDSSEFELYSSNTQVNSPVADMRFLPDDKQIFFSTNSVWIVDLNTKQKRKLLTKPKCGPNGQCGDFDDCGSFSLNDISADGQRLLIRNNCWEYGKQMVLDLSTGLTGNIIENFDTRMLGFLTKETFLAINDAGENETTGHAAFGVYDIQGKLIREILKFYYVDGSLLFDNKSYPGKVYLNQPSIWHTIDSKSIYELDIETLDFKKTTEARDIIVVLSDDQFSFWKTNTELEEPQYLDESSIDGAFFLLTK